MPRLGARFRSLDAARGLAALAVAVCHFSAEMMKPGHGWLGDALLSGWAGVYIFFPISGYCILAAVESPRNRTLGRFLIRRWRRIFPPYWASIALTLGVALLALPWNRGSSAELVRPAWQWLSIATLTQLLTRIPRDVNVVYWSLCFEEQFYLVMAATLLLGARGRRLVVLALSVVGLLYRLPGNTLQLPGLFLERWMEFAVGMAIYDFAEGGARRAFALCLLALAAATGATAGLDHKVFISLGAALLLIALRPVDERLSASRSGRLLGVLGALSYSLYLIHVPIGGRVVNLLRRWLPAPPWTALVGGAAVVVSLVAAALFHRLIERRFLNTSTDAPSATAAVERTAA
jgi:peptidoglycan/LPS O-acetylase OafA/YrhL